MDYRKSFADWYKTQVANNVGPYSGLQGFSAGVEAEHKRIIALINSYCDANRHAFCECPVFIALIKGENE